MANYIARKFENSHDKVSMKANVRVEFMKLLKVLESNVHRLFAAVSWEMLANEVGDLSVEMIEAVCSIG
jgi:hypothetical protein